MKASGLGQLLEGHDRWKARSPEHPGQKPQMPKSMFFSVTLLTEIRQHEREWALHFHGHGDLGPGGEGHELLKELLLRHVGRGCGERVPHGLGDGAPRRQTVILVTDGE